ncbi:leucine-rich repeat neuronal protein 3 [Pseudonaja textilis]|uniref:leucine-rich repeat neuronal protein 3 n=1 Tax=Pseudonaja textilis TaxID=8673 RepID=UPI000EA851E8|nr:leucine-rich repeat neuronal protein 3 [Pseudonaja textilis]
MKDMSVQIYFLFGLTITAPVQPLDKETDCPQSCSCEIRPWFTPRSIYTEASTVDCNNVGLFTFPPQLPANTQVLLLQANHIKKIEYHREFPVNLTGLYLSQNSLSKVATIKLQKITQLLSVYLEENKLTELPDRCFVGLNNLQELYINHNLLSTIASGAFTGLDNLLRLHLNSNNLQIINSKWFESIPNLEVLMIGENPISRIEDMNFKSLINLRSLVLAGINLTEIPDNALAGLDHLESISFYDNRLIKVPHRTLQKATNLKFLDLNKNPINRIQRGDFSNMIHLKELGINNMPELISIDNLAVENLPDLRKIEATNNPRLSYIHPNAFYRLPRLESLMLNSNALSALYHSTIESLPNLKEISIHSNPMRCDCVIRWINMNKTSIRFMESESLFCVDPPEFQGQNVRMVHFREMTEICLPLIAPKSFPANLNLETGSYVSLHCRATAVPEPEVYWITPSGHKLLPNTVSLKYYVHSEGTLEISDITQKESGLYTCIATNLVGADLKSIMINVDGSFPQENHKSFSITVEDISYNSILVSWKANSKIVKSNIRWTAFPKDGNSLTSQRVRIPSHQNIYNFTHLTSSMEYKICIDIPIIWLHNARECINVTTKELDLAMRNCEKSSSKSPTILFCLAFLLGFFCVAAFLSCICHEMNCDAGHRFFRNYVKKQSFSFSELYPLLISSWDADKEKSATLEVQVTVVEVPINMS